MSKPHQINVADLKRKKDRIEIILFVSGVNGNIVRLIALFNGVYRVTLPGDILYEGKDPEAAVQAYNSIQEGKQ